jgi:alpha-galactosidase
LPDAIVFHHTPALPLFKPSPWCVLEYASSDSSRAVVGIFRLTGPADGSYRFRPRGLRASNRYRVSFDNSGDVVEVSGLELRSDGIKVRLESPLTSELLLFERA